MAHNLDWIEELMSYIENQSSGMVSKVDSITDPDRYRTTDALSLIKQDGEFFQKMEELLDSLEDAERLAGDLASAIDGYLEEKAKAFAKAHKKA